MTVVRRWSTSLLTEGQTVILRQQQQQQQSHRGRGGYDDQVFSKTTALIFVLDAQDEPYDHVLQSFTDTVTRSVRANPSIAVEDFVH